MKSPIKKVERLDGEKVSVLLFTFRTKRDAEAAHALLYHALKTIMEDDGLTLAQIREALKKSLFNVARKSTKGDKRA